MILPSVRRKAAFTLIELLVVMLITGIILGMSIAGFITYNQNTTVQTAQNDFITLFRNVRNSAQNSSVQVDPSTLGSRLSQKLQYIYYYTIDIQQNSNPDKVQLLGSYCINNGINPNHGTPPQEFTLYSDSKDIISRDVINTNPTTSTCIAINGQEKTLNAVTFSTTPASSGHARLIFETVTGRLFTQTGTDVVVSISKGSKQQKIKFYDNSNGKYEIL